jgi:hypothetical protein
MTDPRRAGACEDCGGRTIEFQGLGKDTLYRLCPLWLHPGHLTEEQWRNELRRELAARNPSGRQA